MSGPFRTFLANVAKPAVDAVAEGFELRPVTAPIKNIAAGVWAFLAVLFIGAKLAMDFGRSTGVKEVAAWVVTASFPLALAVLLLQWNRSKLRHQALYGPDRHQTSNPTGSQLPK
jgi:hypothetical protein